ncbi:hypothetical protein H4R21_001734 [Coemansia helicoidea]|uniref:Uncharacterized protein n=1 Tax=Coemansia helicoidea TaxID=1286919 RepID=A0ACC1LB55_9FUNG|nr:hypothetical protein H4R21_001734 [Coemansia helicoidea]
MLLCNLPADILTIVLKDCLAREEDKVDELKSNLPLLAVCRPWRCVAIPLVYDLVFVQYGDDLNPRSDSITRDPNVEEPTDTAVLTNLDLVAMVGCAGAVRHFDIEVHFLANPFPGWREVIQRMRAVAAKWRVMELTLAMHPDFVQFDYRDVDMDKYANDIVEVGDALAALMPDVRHLECGGVKNNPIAHPLYGRVASHYADKLQQLSSGHPLVVPPGCRFMRLKEIDTHFGIAGEHQLPPMAGGEMVDMRLLYVPPHHSWESFSTDGDSQDIEFTNLKQLHVALSLGITYSRGDASGFPAINRILESARGSESLELVINDHMLRLEPEHITCTALTHLQVWPITSADTMLAIIARLPNLVNATFSALDLFEVQADLSVPAADEDTVVEPLHRSLERLDIRYDTERNDQEVGVALAKYMLLRLPTLTELLAAQTPEEPVLSFVEEYVPRYPHLSDIELTLYAGGDSEYEDWEGYN